MDWILLIISIIFCNLVGYVSSLITKKALPTWYRRIKKPKFTPKNEVFMPIWIILYTLMGISLYFVWSQHAGSFEFKFALAFFGIQLLLNFLWSVLFFGVKNLLGAFIDLIALFIFIILTMIMFYGFSAWSTWLLIPYALWIIFAGVLNFSIYRLNR